MGFMSSWAKAPDFSFVATPRLKPGVIEKHNTSKHLPHALAGWITQRKKYSPHASAAREPWNNKNLPHALAWGLSDSMRKRGFSPTNKSLYQFTGILIEKGTREIKAVV